MKKLLPLVGIGFLIGGILAWLVFDRSSRDGFLSGGAALLGSTNLEAGSEEESEVPRVGAMAPDFQLSTFDNRIVRLSDLRGHPVLINFWATWCGPCRIEMPAIQSRFAESAPDLKVLAVNLEETPAQIETFARELSLEFDLLVDPEGAVNGKEYYVRAYPSSFFIDRSGVIQVIHLGLMTESQLDDYLERIGVN
jgi:peroxiredoxin